MTGLCNKDFWEGLKEWDVIVLSETWIEGGGWNRWRSSRGDVYGGWQGAKKESRSGRARGGMVMGIRKDITGGGLVVDAKEEV